MNTLVPYKAELPATPDSLVPKRYNDASPVRTFFAVLTTRAWLGIAIAVATIAIVLAIGLQMPRTYYAESSILVEPHRANLATAEQVQQQGAGIPDTSAIDTEVELLKSPTIAEAVVRSLRLFDDPEFNAYLPKDVGAKPTIYQKWVKPYVTSAKALLGMPTITVPPDPNNKVLIAHVVDALQQQSFVRRVGLTYVVRIGVVSKSPQKSERIADEYVGAYMAHQLDEKLSAVNKANGDLDSSVSKLRQDALDAESKLQEYKNANNLMSVEGATLAEAEVSQLNRQIAEAKADHAEKQARLDAALGQIQRGSGGTDVVAALNSETIRELRKKEADTSTQLAQLETRFKPEYPELKRTQAELDDVHRQIQLEINRIISGLRSEAQASGQRENSLLASELHAQGGLQSNNRARVGLVALEQRADAAKKIYEAYVTRASQVTVERTLQQADATVNYNAAGSARVYSPNIRLTFALAGFLGLLSGAASILVAELWNRRIRSRSDIENEIGLPLAGVLPDFRSVARLRRRSGPADHLVQYPFTAFAEAFRNLRAYLMLSDQSAPSKIIAVASAVPGEGKTMTSVCLARTLAQTGSSVVLVDCDLRQRGVTKFIGGAKAGLVEAVEDNLPLQQVLVRDTKTDAWILPASGKRVPYDLFSKAETDDVMRKLAEKFDYVILDTPPLLGMADARILVAKADRVLYLVEWNKTPTSTARAAVDVLHESGANIAGALLTKVNAKQQARYGYGDGSDYFHYYRRQYMVEA